MEGDSEKNEIIQEIERRIKNLMNTDRVSDAEKMAIARKALEIIEQGEKAEPIQ
jgi:hypothetical protein